MTTTTEPPITDAVIAASCAMLRARGMVVKPHGLKWLIKQTTNTEQVVLTLSPEDLLLVAGLAHEAGEGVTLDVLRDLLYDVTGEPKPGEKADAPPTTAIEPRAAALTPIVMMDEAEARESISFMRAELEQVDVSLTSFRRRALEFKEREGWRAL